MTKIVYNALFLAPNLGFPVLWVIYKFLLDFFIKNCLPVRRRLGLLV